MYSCFLLIQYKYYIPLIVKSHLKSRGSHTTLWTHLPLSLPYKDRRWRSRSWKHLGQTRKDTWSRKGTWLHTEADHPHSPWIVHINLMTSKQTALPCISMKHLRYEVFSFSCAFSRKWNESKFPERIKYVKNQDGRENITQSCPKSQTTTLGTWALRIALLLSTRFFSYKTCSFNSHHFQN